MADNPYTTGNPYIVKPTVPVQQEQPNYTSTGPKTVSGYGGKGEALAMFADKFLAGVSKGQQQAFNKQQTQRAQLQDQINQAYNVVQNADVPQEVKNAAFGKLTGIKMMDVYHAVHTSKDKDNPAVKTLKNVFEGVFGEGKKKYEWNEDKIGTALSGVYSTIFDPKNNIQAREASYNEAATNLLNTKYKGKQPTVDELNSDPDVQKLFNQSTKDGTKPPQAIVTAMQQAQEREKQKNAVELADTRIKNNTKNQDRQHNINRYNQEHAADPGFVPVDLDTATETQVNEGRDLNLPSKIKEENVVDEQGNPVKANKDYNHPNKPLTFASGPHQGEPIPKEWQLIDLTYKGQQDRLKAWGEFGTYYKAGLANPAWANLPQVEREKKAEAYAYQHVENKYVKTMGNIEQQMMIRYVNTGQSPSGILPSATETAPGQGAPSAPPKPAATGTPPGQSGSLPAYQQGANQPKPAAKPLFMAPTMQSPSGLLSPGNIDLTKRPQVKNKDGSVSTVRSMSFEQDGKEILIPTVSKDGRILSDNEAIAQYRKTGETLGIFKNAQDATKYAQQLHTDYESGKIPGFKPAGQASTTPPGQTSAKPSAAPPEAGPIAKMNPTDRMRVRAALDASISGQSGASQKAIVRDGYESIRRATVSPEWPNGITQEEVDSRADLRKADKTSLTRIGLLTESSRKLESSLDRNATILTNLRPKLPDTDVTKINEWLISGAEQFNVGGVSQDAIRYGLALQAVRNEYSRVIASGAASAGMTPEGARKDAGEKMQAGFTSGGIQAMVDQMRLEAKQTIAGGDDERALLRQRLSQPLVPELYGQKYQDPEKTPRPGDTTPGRGGEGSNLPPRPSAIPENATAQYNTKTKQWRYKVKESDQWQTLKQ